MVDAIENEDTAPFDIRKPLFYHNLNWDLISGEHTGLLFRNIWYDLMDTQNLGYRIPQDFYEFITVSSYPLAIERERERGITPKRELELKKAENSIINQFNQVITWTYNEPKPDYKPKIPITFRLLGDPFRVKPGLTLPRLKPDMQPTNVVFEKYGTTHTERIQDIFHRFEQNVIKKYYYPMTWVRDSNGNLHLSCLKSV
jgi:hypothetical protein